MSTDLPKTYDPSAVESEAYRVWLEERAFHAEPTDAGEPYAIVIPPPNVTAALHLGHALNNTIQDVLTRYHRMRQENACWLPGTDHAGIATQTIVDRRLQAEGQPALKDYKRQEVEGKNGREQFISKVQAWKDEYEKKICDQLKAMGCSCDWDRQAFTMDEPRARAVREAFFQLFKDGLIYRGKRLVNWDPVSQTALADDEVEMEEVDGQFYYLRYPLVGSALADAKANASDIAATGDSASAKADPTCVTVATTRPETMLGDTAVAINPKDPRAAALRGKFVKLPIVNRVIPIVEDDYVVLPMSLGGDPEDAKAQFATGFLKVTPAHDPNDYEIGRRHNLPQINVMAPDASISDKHGWTDIGDGGFLLGKSREEARKLIVKWFKEQGLLEEMKPYKHAVGHSYRSHVPIEPYLSDQWYCKVTDDRLAGAALRAMAPEQRSTATSTETSPPLPPGEGRGEGSRDAGSLPETKTEGTPSANLPSPQPARGQSPNPLASPGGRGSHAPADEGQLRFYPARYAKTFQTWHENIRDWCISRQLWWGHRIPVWSLNLHASCGEGSETLARAYFAAAGVEDDVHIIAQGDDDDCSLFICSRSAIADRALIALNAYYHVDADARGPSEFPELAKPNAAAAAKSLMDGPAASQVTQDPDVLDTWFSSGLWPMSTLHWPDESEIQNPKSALNTWNPSNALCTAREIITLWVSRMVMFNCYFRDCLPFRDVFIHAMIQDGEGQKMSKTLGNGVDPLDIIHSHGADAMRYTLAAMTTHTQDLKMPVDMIDPHSGTMFQPEKITISGGKVVAAPIQASPKDPTKKMVSSYGMSSGKAKPTAEMPLAMNTSSKFDLGRNFCNKIWNAARFALANLVGSALADAKAQEGASGATGGSASADAKAQEGASGATGGSASAKADPTDESKWSMADRWIVSRFNRTVAECDAALKEYRFDVYAKSCYDFFWRDFCDWYLEAIKPAMKDAARAGQTSHILAALLDGSLRLMHPAIPFITETIWWKLNEVRPQRGLPGRLECPPSRRLVKAAWPKVGDISDAAEHIFPKIQELITSIRQIRNDRQVNPKQVVSVTVAAASERARSIEMNREVIESLALCTLKIVEEGAQPPANAARGTAAGVEVFIEGLVDESAEKGRLLKRRDELQKQKTALEGRLANPAYTNKAPPHLVQQTRDQLAAVVEELKRIEEELKKLGE